jgi:hypothetical protein
MTALPAALALAARGFALFPCRQDKASACPHGHINATRDPAAVRDQWWRWPGDLIGTSTGTVNGFDALDIDPRHGGDVWHTAHTGPLSPTRIHQTRSGGLHILFRDADGVRNSAGKIAPGVDVRGEGGFVILVAGGRLFRTGWRTAGAVAQVVAGSVDPAACSPAACHTPSHQLRHSAAATIRARAISGADRFPRTAARETACCSLHSWRIAERGWLYRSGGRARIIRRSLCSRW